MKKVTTFGSKKVVVGVEQPVTVASGASCTRWWGGVDWPHRRVTLAWLLTVVVACVGTPWFVCACGCVSDSVELWALSVWRDVWGCQLCVWNLKLANRFRTLNFSFLIQFFFFLIVSLSNPTGFMIELSLIWSDRRTKPRSIGFGSSSAYNSNSKFRVGLG